MSDPVVGYVGFGEAAKCFAAHLHGAGLAQLVYCEGGTNRPPYSAAFLNEAASRGVEARDTLAELAAEADVIVSAVVVANAVAVGEAIAACLRPGTLVVDINATSPSQKRAVAASVEARGGGFVDANLMGSASLYGARVPLYCSGSGVGRFWDLFSPRGLSIEVAGPEAGAAATVKMLRSVVTKGIEALVVEAMVAAGRAGVREEALRGICEPMDATTFSDFVDMCIRTDVLHSGRRAVEMDGVAEAIEELGMEAIMTRSTSARLRASAALGLRSDFAIRPTYSATEVLQAYGAQGA